MILLMGDLIVTMEHIDKSFPGVQALKDVHFELRSGEVMALLGENGAGKSTLMKILSGVYTRDSGSMHIFGQEQGDLTPRQAQALGVAIIHQELNMCRHLSVAENIARVVAIIVTKADDALGLIPGEHLLRIRQLSVKRCRAAG